MSAAPGSTYTHIHVVISVASLTTDLYMYIAYVVVCESALEVSPMF